MIFTAVIAAIVVTVLGLVSKSLFKIFGGTAATGTARRIAWSEFLVTAIVMIAIVIPSTVSIGKKLSVDNIVRYTQFVNGVETKAVDTITKCYAGHHADIAGAGHSNCEYAWISGYNNWTTVTYTENCTTDKKGNRSCTKVRHEDHHHEAIYTPYATVEHRYTIDSSMGGAGTMSYDFDGVYLDANPQPFSGRNIPTNYPRGAPADWIDADNHLKNGDPRPVTKLADYDNYILATSDPALKAASSNIEQYKKAGLMPAHTANILTDPIKGPSRSQADKVSFEDVTVPNPAEWQSAVMRFDAALGLKLQGDLHVVLVNTTKVPSSEAVTYTNAVKAYWESAEFGKRAIAKNGVILVLGVTDNTVIDWAQATTGMPFGNELMAQYLIDGLPGVKLDTRTIFGLPTAVMISTNTAMISHPSPEGIVEHVMFEQAPFLRARMSCDDGKCVGYKDLVSKIDPTPAQQFWMVFVAALISLGLWLIVGFTSIVDDTISPFIGRWKAAGPQPNSDTDVDPYDPQNRSTTPSRMNKHGRKFRS